MIYAEASFFRKCVCAAVRGRLPRNVGNWTRLFAFRGGHENGDEDIVNQPKNSENDFQVGNLSKKTLIFLKAKS